MTTGHGGKHFSDAGTDLNAASFNQLKPHGFVFQDSGDGDLEVSVGAANWLESDGTFNEYAGSANNAIPASVSRWVYIDDTNTLQVAASLPALSNDFFICGRVTTNGSEVTGIDHVNMPSQAYRT